MFIHTLLRNIRPAPLPEGVTIAEIITPCGLPLIFLIYYELYLIKLFKINVITLRKIA